MGGGEKSLFCPVGVAALSKPFIRSERGGRGGGGILTPLVFRRRKRVSPPLCLRPLGAISTITSKVACSSTAVVYSNGLVPIVRKTALSF